MKNKYVTVEDLLHLFAVIFLVFASGGNLFIRSIFLLIASCMLLLIYNCKINRSYLMTSILLIGYVVFDSVIVNTAETDYKEVVLLSVRVLCCAIIATNISVKKFRALFLRLITFLAVISLFFFFLVIIGVDLPFSKGVEGVYGAFYHTVGHGDGLNSIIRFRNCGIFTEPGIFQIYLNTALLLLPNTEGISSKIMKIYFVILSLALVTTRSSMGYLIYALVLCKYYVDGVTFFGTKETVSKKKRTLLFGLAVVGIVSFELLTDIVGNFIAATNSFSSRHYDILLTFKMAADYPIFGIGLATDPIPVWDEYYETYSSLRLYKAYQNAMSCGIGNYLAMGGIPFSLIYIYCMMKSYIKLIGCKVKLACLISGVIVLMIIFEEPLLPAPFFLMAFFAGQKNTRVVYGERRNECVVDRLSTVACNFT